MKKLILVLFCLGFAGSACVVAQSRLEQIRNRVKEKVEQRVEAKTEEGIDKVLDKTEEAVKKTTKKNKNESSPAEKGKSEPAASAATGKTRSDVSYTKYDFVPGNEVIFEDDLQGEQKGEFPSKWDLMEGNAEIAQINGENTIALVGYTYITPLFKDHSYQLPDEFTLEFDVFIDNQEGENSIEFVNKNEELIANSLFWKDNTRFLFNWNQTSAEKTSEDSYDNSPGWHHYALSFNKRAMKVYMDSKRVANIPNIAEKPVKVKFFARGPEDNSTLHIKNIRLAKGAVPLYDKLMTDGKIVTHGITFDVGKATIKPQSMGTINEIYSILQKNASLRFSVEGHTDNTGNAASNQALSEARANAVCEKLQQMGIDAARLKARGHGMSKPMDTNNTAEGRAKNRRVEFVVLK
ncbi:MAG: OmpA family protein [Bacteroidales bacterium]|nr:OmpA family protein [Bacteroidales bacterium]